MTTLVNHLDDSLACWIGAATLMVEHDTGRRCLLVDGGRFVRCGRSWEYHDNRGDITLVTVPSTIAALEARDTELRRTVAA